jgi:CelD/BcsL family acetyltransferase involved in cellulose biosynthesis
MLSQPITSIVDGPSASFSLTRLPDITDIAARWRALEAVANASFFQTWTWLNCLGAERFPHAYLFAAQRNGVDVALALFNRHPTRLAPNTLYLGETGIPAWDALYIEHNGLLCADGHQDIIAPALAWLAGQARIVLSGIDDTQFAAARDAQAALRVRLRTKAPFVDLDRCPAGPQGLIAHCSANTRQQITRSARRYTATFGPLRITRAHTTAEALALFDTIGALHQTTWRARGKPGAFANPNFCRFHRQLITTALPLGTVDLLAISAGEHMLGGLYHFRHNNHVLSYQSGFDYSQADAQYKPGLTAHHLALTLYRDEGVNRYDLLAGDARYKTSLANGLISLHWADLQPRWSARGILTRLQSALQPQ